MEMQTSLLFKKESNNYQVRTSLSNSTRYRMKSLGNPKFERRTLFETVSRSKRSRVLWPRPCRRRSQSKMAMGMAMLREQKKKKDHAEKLNFMPSEIFL